MDDLLSVRRPGCNSMVIGSEALRRSLLARMIVRDRQWQMGFAGRETSPVILACCTLDSRRRERNDGTRRSCSSRLLSIAP